jgi:hypothetical protein
LTLKMESVFLWNVSGHLPDYMPLHTIKQYSSKALFATCLFAYSLAVRSSETSVDISQTYDMTVLFSLHLLVPYLAYTLTPKIEAVWSFKY